LRRAQALLEFADFLDHAEGTRRGGRQRSGRLSARADSLSIASNSSMKGGFLGRTSPVLHGRSKVG
jgi:hypothetical protein